ncbi:MAG: putative rane protein [Gemmatimonadetes bacterium]|nr:putative rane protein [Gemmatimonadota bacterium]
MSQSLRCALMPARALPVALAVSCVLWLNPYFTWENPNYFRASMVVVVVAFVEALGTKRGAITTRNALLALFLLSLFLYFGAHRAGGIFELSSGWLVLLLFILSDDEVKHQAFHYFSSAFAISLVPGIIVVVLLAIGVELPWHTLSSSRYDYAILTGDSPPYYRQYWGSVILYTQLFPVGPGWVARLHGMFDEPGTVGTFAALLFAANGGRIKGSKRNAVLLIGGLLSFSLGFYALALLYLLLRKPLRTLLASGAIAAVLASSSALRDSSVIQAFFLQRLASDNGRSFGDTRVNDNFTTLYRSFWNADLWTRLFGSGQDVTPLIYTGTFSYKLIFYSYGVVGAVALLTFLLVSTTAISRNKAATALLVVFCVSIYQRPNVLMLPYLLLLLGGAAHLRHLSDAPKAGLLGGGRLEAAP